MEKSAIKNFSYLLDIFYPVPFSKLAVFHIASHISRNTRVVDKTKRGTREQDKAFGNSNFQFKV